MNKGKIAGSMFPVLEQILVSFDCPCVVMAVVRPFEELFPILLIPHLALMQILGSENVIRVDGYSYSAKYDAGPSLERKASYKEVGRLTHSWTTLHVGGYST